jgi:hypothetical protein
MVRAYLTSGFKDDIEIENWGEVEPGWIKILHPELGRFVTVPADQIIFKELDVGDIL